MTSFASIKLTLCGPSSHRTTRPRLSPNRDQLTLLAHHKSQFSVEPSPIFQLIESFAARNPPDILEPSIKVVGAGADSPRVFAQRCNLYYYDASRLSYVIGEILDLYDKAQVIAGHTLGHDILGAVMDAGFAIEHCRNVVVGVDVRPEITESRFKLYFLLKEHQAAFAQKLYDIDTNTRSYPPPIVNWTRLFGIDFGFDQTSALKVYPGLPHEEYKVLTRALKLGGRARALIRRAPFCMFSALNADTPLQLLLTGEDIAPMITPEIADTLRNNRRYILSAPSREFENERLTGFNLYYTTSDLSGEITNVQECQ